MRGRAPRVRCALSGVATLLALGALAAALTWAAIFELVLSSQLTLTPTSRSFKEWKEPSVPLYFEVFLFNWTNPENFPEEKPHLQQLGPYSFREERSHVNLTWHNHNNSLAYRTLRRFFFDPETSNGSLDDNIVTLNAVAASAAYRSREWTYLLQKGLSISLSLLEEHIFVSKTVGEILFDGYEDPLLDMAKDMPSSVTGGALPVDKFGWFYSRNNSLDSDGYMEVTSGSESGSLPGQILRWNFEAKLPYYSEGCAEIRGSAGEFLPHNLTEESRLTMFMPDLCRTVHMDYIRTGELDGLGYHTYALSDDSFDNSSSGSTCFCSGECWLGIMNVSLCRHNSPAFLSLPHFYRADPKFREMVSGMQPDPLKHEFYFSVEPKLGTPVEVIARFQLNIYLEPSPYIALFENVPKMLFPVFWVQEKVTIDRGVIGELRTARSILEWGATVCICAAIFFALLVVIITFYGRNRKLVPKSPKQTSEKKDEAELKLNPK